MRVNIVYCAFSYQWPPELSYGKNKTAECSLLQISLPTEVFIFDMQVLSPYQSPRMPKKDLKLCELARSALEQLFSDSNVVKLGWDLYTADFPVLRKSAQGFFAPCFANVESVLDLQDFAAAYKERFQMEDKVRSLSDCCGFFLGRKVNKDQQLSAWDSRPLSTAQLNYAALDAHSLLAVLDSMLISMGDAAVTGPTLTLYPDDVAQRPRQLLAAGASSKRKHGIAMETHAEIDTLSNEFVQSLNPSASQASETIDQGIRGNVPVGDIATNSRSSPGSAVDKKSKRPAKLLWRQFITGAQNMGKQSAADSVAKPQANAVPVPIADHLPSAAIAPALLGPPGVMPNTANMNVAAKAPTNKKSSPYLADRVGAPSGAIGGTGAGTGNNRNYSTYQSGGRGRGRGRGIGRGTGRAGSGPPKDISK